MNRVEFYDHWAEHYDQQQASRMRLEIPSVTRLLEERSGNLALDVGCGTGLYLPCLLERFHSVMGVDSSSKMLDRARSRHQESYGGRLRLIHAAFEDLDLGHLECDLILCAMVLNGVATPARFIRRFSSLLAPSGWLVLSVYHPILVKRRQRLQVSLPSGPQHIPFDSNLSVQDYLEEIRQAGLRLQCALEPRIDRAFAEAFPHHQENIGLPHVLVVSAVKL